MLHLWTSSTCLGLVLLSSIVAIAKAGDWPQILGPRRNGTAVDERITAAWPEAGPQTVWEREVGRGFAGLAVAEGVAVLSHRVGDREIVEGMEPLTGSVIWKAESEATYVPSYTDDDGPRAVPVIDRRRVYVYGATGTLRCLDLKSGELVWARDTYEEFNSKRISRGEPPEGYFGMASSPIVVGDKLLVNVGGDDQGAGIVAFRLEDGRTAWTATRERASYSSPVAVTVNGARHVVFVTRLSVVSLDPDTGAVRFQFPFGRLGPTVSAASPVVLDGHLLVTASYGIGSVLVKIKDDGADVLWRDTEILASQYTTCVEHEGRLFGIDGRQDGPPADLKCFDPKTRNVLWTEPSFGYATLMKADGKLLILKTDGLLVLAALSPNRYEEIARARIADATTRALPALSNGYLYVRDTRRLKCLDLRPREGRIE